MQNFLRSLLAYGVDDEESEMTLGFWYLFQEALRAVDFCAENGDDDDHTLSTPDLDYSRDPKQLILAKAVYMELMKVLRRKVAFPPPGSGWSRGMWNFLLFLSC